MTLQPAAALVAELHAMGVRLWAEGDRLRINAPKGVLTEALRARLTEHKAALLTLLQAAAGEGATAITAVARPERIPLAPSQQRLWFLCRFDHVSAAYNMPTLLHLDGRLKRDALARAFAEIVRRHESLRTSFREDDGVPYQVIHAPSEPPLPFFDLSDLAADAAEAEAARLAEQEARHTFDLEQGPLLRLNLIQTAPQHHHLLITIHHLVSDGWSAGVFAQELAVLYNAFAADQPSPLAEPTLQFADVALWQQAHHDAAQQQRRLQFWCDHLRDAPMVLELPTDRARPALQRFHGRRLAFAWDAALGSALNQAASAAGCSLAVYLQTLFAVVLARHARCDDLVLGMPAANRNRLELEGLIGFFVNTLALRYDLRDAPTFAELLRRTQATMTAALDHADVPFDRVVEALQPRRDPSRQPLVQVVFALQNAPAQVPALDGLQVTAATAPAVFAKFDLVVEAAPRADGGIAGTFEYNTDLFDEITIQRLIAHFETLTRAALDNPAMPVTALPLIEADERARLLGDWNRFQAPLPSAPCIHAEIEAVVARSPEAPALATWADVAARKGRALLSYAELNRRANQLAHALRAQGIGPERVVAVVAARDPRTVVALLAVLKAGGVYLPVNPNDPDERINWMLEDAQAALLLDPAEVLGERRLGADISRAHGDVDGFPTTNPDLRTTADNAAYLIYTSGSTGRPKGVVVPHRGMCNLAPQQARNFGVAPGARWLQTASLCFDMSLSEILLTLSAGAELVLLPARHLLPGPDLELALRFWSVTHVFMPPSLLAAMPFVALPALTTLVIGGEACPQNLVDTWAAHYTFFNAYGPTEYTVHSTQTRCRVGEVVTIGTPIQNTRAMILDERLEPVPIGVPGELCIAGPGLARAYQGRADLTAARFVPDPHAVTPGERLYRTGDLARWDASGAIHFLGRCDDQVKLRGFRIEPGEISAALRRLTGVHQAVTVLRRDRAEARLVAYVVHAGNAPADWGAQLRTALAATLPAFMLPAAVVVLDALPLTANGKIDTRALPADEPGAVVDAQKPVGDLETRIAAIWAEVLGRTEVPVTANFFDLGGHSLLLGRVRARLEQALAREVAMLDLFEYPTVRGLAKYFDGVAHPTATANARTTPPTPNDDDRAVAIIGIAGRFPQSDDPAVFWRNLCDGVEAIETVTAEELREAGVSAATAARRDYVAKGGFVPCVELFDAAFFDIPPWEAETMDPQHRLFLQSAWSALEDAGYAPGDEHGRTGVFSSLGMSEYLFDKLLHHPDKEMLFTERGALTGNTNDYLPARTSYKLNLTGPSFNVQASCAGSLAAVHIARNHILQGECDMALAGGVCLHVPHRTGYTYYENSVYSPDGRTRSFDAAGLGTVNTNGVGIVVLKRLSRALADGDSIYAVIRGAAMNNDGADKVGAAAPSLVGLTNAAAGALRDAGVAPEAVGYVEAHAGGTQLGDAIEVTALARAYAGGEPGRCRLGSLKPNFGLMSAASGVASLIKVALSLHHETVPATINFETLNPKIDGATLPFRINTQTEAWPRDPYEPRYAGVNSFGRAGTNVHLVLSEAPLQPPSPPCTHPQCLLLSARSPQSLYAATAMLCHFLMNHPDANLADVAWTLQVGRRHFEHRRALIVRNHDHAVATLMESAPLMLHVDTPALNAAAKAWLAGESPDWAALHDTPRRRLHLPVYPFQGKTFWMPSCRAENGLAEILPFPNKNYARPTYLGTWQPPQGPLETSIAAIWQQRLGIDRVGRDDNFFELGGHSIFATKVINDLREQHGAELKLAAIFAYPTPAQLAAHLETTQTTAAVFPFAPDEEDLDDDGFAPLSFAQERLLFLDQLLEQHVAYSLPFAVRLNGPLNRAALVRALSELADRHDSLRTVFRIDNGKPVAHVQAKGAFQPEFATLSESASDGQNAIDAVLQPHALRPFQLDQELPFRALILRINAEQHVLQVVLHHIVADGWSLGNLTRELGTLYDAYAHGTAAALPILPISYAAYAAGERRLLAGEQGREGLRYWVERLAGVPTRLALPTDRPHSGKRSYNGGNYYYDLAGDLAESLEQLALRHQTGLFTCLHAAFSVLLHRLSGETDIVVGTPVGNRRFPQTEAMIGLFVNTLALRTQIDAKQPFSQLLDRVRGENLRDFDHGDIPFERVVAATRPQRELNHSPLFQVVLALQNDPRQPLHMQGLQVEPHVTGTDSALFEITWFFTRERDRLVCSLEYDSDLYDQNTMQRWAGHFETLLRAICAAPDTPCYLLPLVDRAEQQRLLNHWNSTDTGFPRGETAHQAFEKRAAAHPERVSLRWAGRSMTFAALNQRANQLAHALLDHGIGTGATVAILLPAGFDMVACAVAVLKTNACYLPIDLGMPAQRLEFMLRDAGATHVFTDSAFAAERARHGIPDELTVFTPDSDARLAQYPTDNPNLPTSSILPAYMIYTSGSTGRPKGVTVTHQNLVSLMMPGGRGMFREDEVVMQLSSFSFDLSAWQIWGALLSGARLVLLPPEGLDRLPEAVRAEGVTNLVAVSHLMNLLVDQSLEALGDLRCLGSTGEAASAAHFRAARRRYPELEIVNVYGPTECTIIATGYTMGDDVNDPVPIGKPLPERRAYVLDAAMNPCVPGVVGDLYLGGPGVVLGYHRRPALTAEKFVPNPFAVGAEAGARLYATGDLARVLPNGDIEFLGRADHQVKLRGFRVELGDIETTLAESPYCRRVHAGLHRGANGDQHLVAYMERVPGADATAETLRAYLAERLPEYMVPAFFLFLDELPMNPNGKLDRRALPAVNTVGHAAEQSPRGPIEEKLVAIWADVLAGTQPGIHDNFFELGGNSISLLRVRGQIERELGRKTAMVTLFEHTTIAELARHFANEAKPTTATPSNNAAVDDHDERERRKRAFRAKRGRNA